MGGVAKIEQDTTLAGALAIGKVRDLLPAFRSCMFITQAIKPSIGREQSVRPMALQGDTRTFGGALWFFADERSRKIEEINHDSRTSVLFQSDDHIRYLHLFGEASVVRDRAKMHELYTPLVRTWFPDGLDDPHLTLVRFDAHGGSFWDSPGGLLQALGAFTKSVVSGRPGSGGESGTLLL